MAVAEIGLVGLAVMGQVCIELRNWLGCRPPAGADHRVLPGCRRTWP